MDFRRLHQGGVEDSGVSEVVEQSAGGLQIGRVEALLEPISDRVSWTPRGTATSAIYVDKRNMVTDMLPPKFDGSTSAFVINK